MFQNHILTYECSWCDHGVAVWNPLIAEPPGVVLCQVCDDGRVAGRVDALSRYSPGFILTDGHAYFVEGTAEDAVEKLQRRKRIAFASVDEERFGEEGKEKVMDYYDAQIRLVHEGKHPSFPPGYITIAYHRSR